MGQELYQTSRRAREVLNTVDESLSFSLTKLMFNGPSCDLERTANSQPAIMATSLASLAALEELEVCEPVAPVAFAGHSLGEYTSLVAAGVLDLIQGIQLVQRRGSLMQMAAESRSGGMAAVLGLDEDTLAEVCLEAGVEIANVNSHDQIVISGDKAALEVAMKSAKAAGARRVIPLAVAGAFHSQLMAPAQNGLSKALEESTFNQPTAPIVANLSGQQITTGEEIKQELESQICHCVQWKQSVVSMRAMGVTTFVEFGPGRVLSGLVKRIDRQAKTANVGDSSSAQRVAEQYPLL
jgi:[acyl-carrier-protein] S-malonyltransferase